MKYLGTRSQQYDPVVTQDINNKENAISSTGLISSIEDTDSLVMYKRQSSKTLRILWSEIKSKIETFIRAAFKKHLSLLIQVEQAQPQPQVLELQ